MRIKRNIQSLILAGLLIQISESCSKSEEPNEPTLYPVNQVMLDRFLFEPGSNFIYHDQNNNIDSIVVDSIETYWQNIPCFTCENGGYTSSHECFIMNMTSSNEGTFNYSFISSHFKKNGSIPDGQPIFLFEREIGDGFNGLTYSSHLDSIQINSNWFSEVFVMSIDQENQYQNEFEYDTDLYFTPGIGLIKKIIHDPQGDVVWDLVEWNIE